MIAAEPHDARMLVATTAGIVRVAADGARTTIIAGAGDAAYSPDGTLIAFSRDGDLWLANSDGSGQRRLLKSPHVEEWGASWLPNGQALVYTARVEDRRQIRIFRLPTGPSQRIAGSVGEEYGATVSTTGRLAFVSTRSGTPAVYVANSDGTDAAAFDTTPPATPYLDEHDLAWSPDGATLAYGADLSEDIPEEIVLDDGTTQTPVSTGSQPVWSPSGTRLAWDDASSELISSALDGSELRDFGFAGTPVDWRVVPVGVPKFPNLVQRPPSGLVVEHSGRHWLLGFTSMVTNRGPGILWIRGTRARGAKVMQVHQLVQLAGGGTRIDADSGELRYVVAPPHYHWHFLGFDHYELRSAKKFDLVVRDYKSGFCLADHYGYGPKRFGGNCEQFHPEARDVEEGSSVGYTDRYPAFFHGQQLDITHVRAGLYWLVHRTNEDFHLRETHYGDNAASLLVRIAWRDGAPTVTTLRTCSRERC